MRFLLWGGINFHPNGHLQFYEVISSENEKSAYRHADTVVRHRHELYLSRLHNIHAFLSAVQDIKVFQTATGGAPTIYDVADANAVADNFLFWGTVQFRLPHRKDILNHRQFYEAITQVGFDPAMRQSEKIFRDMTKEYLKIREFDLRAVFSSVHNICSFETALCDEYGQLLNARPMGGHEDIISHD